MPGITLGSWSSLFPLTLITTQSFNKHLLSARHHQRCWGYQIKQILVPVLLSEMKKASKQSCYSSCVGIILTCVHTGSGTMLSRPWRYRPCPQSPVTGLWQGSCVLGYVIPLLLPNAALLTSSQGRWLSGLDKWDSPLQECMFGGRENQILGCKDRNWGNDKQESPVE